MRYIKMNGDVKMKYKRKKGKMNNTFSSVILSLLLAVSVVSAVIVGAADYVIPVEKTLDNTFAASKHQKGICAEIADSEATAKLLGIPLKSIDVSVNDHRKLIPCGSVFGVKFFTKGVMIVGMSDVESTEGILNPAYKSGLRVGDIILEIDGSEVNTVEEIAQKVDKCDGNKMLVRFEREGAVNETNLIPLISLTENKYKTGLWIRDSTAGIGTITYYDPESGDFGGLGHGICDVDTGKLMPMLRANVVDITVTDIVKGLDGMPGEIKGSFGIVKNGELYKNTEEGVFGNLTQKPECAFDEPLDVADANEVHEGEAFIYSSLGNDGISKYTVELTKIYRNNSDTKNFIFTVTDKELLEKTGGIIQGMSGSPIIQDGKLIGAVTHVLVNNPQKGYGIFIENMLEKEQ